jgi:hypothetical protein
MEMNRALPKAAIPAHMLVGEIRLKKHKKPVSPKKRLPKTAKPHHAQA